MRKYLSPTLILSLTPHSQGEGHWGETAQTVWNIPQGKFTITIKTKIIQVDANFSLYSISTPSIRTLYTSLESSHQFRG